MAVIHSHWPILVSGLISGCGLLCSGLYLLRETIGGESHSWWNRLDTAEGVLRRTRRRRLGMAVVAMLSVFFFVGVNFFDPSSAPAAYLAFWAVMAMVLLWLCLLALGDILHTRRQWRALQSRVQADLGRALKEAAGPATRDAE